MLAKSLFCLLGWKHRFKFANGFTNFWFVGCVVEKRFAKEPSALLKNVDRKVAVLVSAVSWSAEGRFKSETIYQIEFSPHHNSCSSFACFLNDKVAIVETKIFGILTK